MAKRTKTGEIRQYLLDGNKITQRVAYEKFHAQRLAGIIFNLKKTGLKIGSVEIKDEDCYGNTCRYSEYFLVK